MLASNSDWQRIRFLPGQKFKTDGASGPCDRVVIQNRRTGEELDAVVYRDGGGKRAVKLVRENMTFPLGAPEGTDVLTSINPAGHPATAEQEKLLLAIYDREPTRTFQS